MKKQHKLLLLATVLASGIVFLDGTVVNIALPTIARNLHTDYSGLQWIVDGYLLSLSAMILFGGSLGDIFGQKRIFILGLSGFGLASLGCGLAPNLTILTTGRIIQGLFGALLVPASLAIINTNFTESQRSRAIGTWNGYASAFTALGPIAGGVLIGLSWRWVFLINIPLIATCIYAAEKSLPDSLPNPNQRHLDPMGGLLAMVSLSLITFGLINGASSGWPIAPTSSLILGLLVGIGFLFYEHNHRDPMLPLSLFKSHNFTAANLATLTMYAALSGSLVSVVLYLQTAVGYTSFEAGAAFLPISLLMMLFSSKIGSLTNQYGARIFMTIGPIIAAIGFLLMLLISPQHQNYLFLAPGVTVFGVGLVLLVAPLTATVMGSVDKANSGIASAINNAVSRIAGLLIIAFLGSIVAYHTTLNLKKLQVPLSQDSITTIRKSVAQGLNTTDLKKIPDKETKLVTETANKTQRSIFVDAMIINAGLAMTSGCISFAMIRSKPQG